jgi:hypothetical protein
MTSLTPNFDFPTLGLRERENIIIIYAKKWPKTKTIKQLIDKLFDDYNIHTNDLEIERLLKR